MRKFFRHPGSLIFDALNILLLLGVVVVTLVPLVHVLAASLSDALAIQQGKVGLWPQGWTLKAYKQVAEFPLMFRSYGNTILYTATGTCLSVILTACTAYPLSRPKFYGRTFFTFLVLFPMLFDPGIVPTFLVVKSFGLYNSWLAIIVPTAISSFYVLIMRAFFLQLPYELEEAAIIDGASRMQCLAQVIIPLSKPAMVTIGLFYGVNLWNSYFTALIYLKDKSLYPIQLILREIVLLSTVTEEMTGDMIQQAASTEAIKYAAIFFTLLPILLVYVWIQKYFVKGMLIGAVKG
jgi:putative aldouronate transport system permease protein